MEISEKIRQRLLIYQRNEITEHHLYNRLTGAIKSVKNKKVLQDIAADELRHYHEWKSYTRQEVRPNWRKVWMYYVISRIFGLTFGLKLMEQGEEGAQTNYDRLRNEVPGADAIIQDEHEHEEALIGLLDEEHLHYMGSIVLGLNDALVELTGGLAGLTLALRNTRLIALSGMIVGIAAALSMAASEYLSTKAEKSEKEPLRSSVYTGVAYVITVVLLITPYLLLDNLLICLALTLIDSILIIAAFNFYISTAMSRPFRRQFLEMAAVSLGVALFSFGLGYLVRAFLGVDV